MCEPRARGSPMDWPASAPTEMLYYKIRPDWIWKLDYKIPGTPTVIQLVRGTVCGTCCQLDRIRSYQANPWSTSLTAINIWDMEIRSLESVLDQGIVGWI